LKERAEYKPVFGCHPAEVNQKADGLGRSDISKVFEVDDTCIFWMDISGLNQCIMKKA